MKVLNRKARSMRGKMLKPPFKNNGILKVAAIKDKKTAAVYALSFALPFLCMLIVYALLKVYPFGSSTVLTMDLNNQYNEFFGYLHRVLTGQDSIIYSFTKEMGSGALDLFAYYLSSPFSVLTLFFTQKTMPICIELMILLKIGCCGLTFAVFLRNVFKRRDWSVVLFSCCYALSTYCVVYSISLMWLDAVIWLPIILLGVERILKNKSPLLFIVAYTLTIFSNYYIAFMTTIFLVIYFVYRYFSANEKKSAHDFFEKALKLLAAGIVCGLLSAVLLLPTFLSMFNGKLSPEFSKYGYPVPEDFWSLKIFEIPRRIFLGQSDVIWNGSMPNIFCGVLCGVLICVYFLNSNIGIGERIGSLCVFAVFAVSFFVKKIDMVWHIFSYPNAFPYRYAYAFCFFALFIAYRGFLKLKKEKPIRIAAGVLIYAALAAAVWLFDKKVINNVNFALLGLAFALIYSAILFLMRFKNRRFVRMTGVVMTLLICVEMAVNGYAMVDGLRKSLGLADYKGYKDAVAKTAAAVKYINDNDSGGGFYRVEKTYQRTDNDNMSAGIMGTSGFSSTFNCVTYPFVDCVGMRRDHIRVKYSGSTMPVDAILGVKYIISDKAVNDDYEQIQKGDNYTIYKNPYAVGIGFAATNEVLNGLPDENTVFDNQNKLTELLFGEKVFKNIQTSGPADSEGKAVFTAGQTGKCYIAADQRHTNPLSVEVNGTKREYKYDSGRDKKVYYVGRVNRGDRVKIGLENEKLHGSVKAAIIDTAALKNGTDGTENRLNITDHGSTWLEGDITLGNDETVFTSIPYERGWTAYVDGKKTEISKAFDTFVAVPAGAGNHHIKLKFNAPGLKISFAVSLLTLLALIVFVNKEKIKAFALSRTKKEIK